jgi:two-component system response regulator YesN
MRVVIIDDEPLARATLISMLAECPIETDVVAEGSKGQDVMILAQKWKPDICFVDIRMPGWDGLKGIKEAKNHSPHTFWIILTGFSEFEYAKEAIALGVTYFLLKPVDPIELNQVIHQVSAMIANQMDAADKPLPSDPTLGAVDAVKKHIHAHFMKDVAIADLAELLNVTPNYLSALFHKQTGETFTHYLTKTRLSHAKIMLLEETISIQEIAESVGYYSPRHFSKKFKAYYGIYPSECRHAKASKLNQHMTL